MMCFSPFWIGSDSLDQIRSAIKEALVISNHDLDVESNRVKTRLEEVQNECECDQKQPEPKSEDIPLYNSKIIKYWFKVMI